MPMTGCSLPCRKNGRRDNGYNVFKKQQMLLNRMLSASKSWEQQSFTEGMGNSMYGKRKAFAIGCGALLVLSVGLNVAQLGKIEALSGQIQDLKYAQTQNEQRFYDIDSKLNSLSSDLSTGNSLLSGSETTVEINESKQLTATVSVIPKEIGPEDTVYISIGDLKEEAVPNGTAYAATLALTQYNADFAPCVTILSPDGTQKQETLGYVSLIDYFELYYSYDIAQNNGQVTIDVGLQPSGGCVLTLPQDIENIWIYAEDSSAKGKSIFMVPDGERIPEASGYTSGNTTAAYPDSESAAVSSSLYYTYYTASFDGLSEMDGEVSFICAVETAGGLSYKIDLGTLSAEDKSEAFGGGGNLYPEWKE